MKNFSRKNFSLQEIYNNSKTKNENIILRVRQIAQVSLLACVPACAHAIPCISGDSVSLHVWVYLQLRKQVLG